MAGLIRVRLPHHRSAWRDGRVIHISPYAVARM
jgi:hypothetical protein